MKSRTFRLVSAPVCDARAMNKRTKIIAAGVVAAAAAVGTAATVAASADDDASDTPITGTELDQATQAALEHTGEGTVTGTEIGDEDSYYEVEVTLDGGRQVDVQLDEQFNVVDTMADQDADADQDD